MSDAASVPAPGPLAAPAAAPPAPPTTIPWAGLTAVLLGTFISTLNGRLSSFGLADIRGAVHAGFDDGAWITTAQTVAQMLIAPIAIWVGGVYGPRRALMYAAPGLRGDLADRAVLAQPAGPAGDAVRRRAGDRLLRALTLGFILRNTPPKAWAWGIAIYALNLELSLNISASLEGWYVDHLSWRFIFWQNAPLALAMALFLRFGVRPDPALAQRPRVDGFGLAASGVGLALIYAALDQGNRLDWLNSGLVWGLLLAGGLLLIAFLVHEQLTPAPFIDLRVVMRQPMPRLLVLIGFLRLTILSTAYLIPQYLGAVRGFRALEVGDTLVWIAGPQLIFCPLAALLLRRTDPRLVSSIGFIFVSLACLMVSRTLTPAWGSDQFLPSQLLQAVGQSFALSGIVFFAVLHLRPQDALTFGAAIQTARLMGGEIGLAFVTTLVRVRSQTASNLIGQHIEAGRGPGGPAAAGLCRRHQPGGRPRVRPGPRGHDPGERRAQRGRDAGRHRRLHRHLRPDRPGPDDRCGAQAGAHRPGVPSAPVRAPRGHAIMTRPRPVPALAVALALLGGCTVGPDYRPAPALPGAEAPLVSINPAAETPAPPPDAWWRLYDDPRLDQLLQSAFAANADLQAAEGQPVRGPGLARGRPGGTLSGHRRRRRRHLWARRRDQRNPRDRRPSAQDHLDLRRRARCLIRGRPVRPGAALHRIRARRRRGHGRGPGRREDHRRRRDRPRLCPGLCAGRADRGGAPCARDRRSRDQDHRQPPRRRRQHRIRRGAGPGARRPGPRRRSAAGRPEARGAVPARRPGRPHAVRRSCRSPGLHDPAPAGRPDPHRRRRGAAQATAGRAPGGPADGGGGRPRRRGHGRPSTRASASQASTAASAPMSAT